MAEHKPSLKLSLCLKGWICELFESTRGSYIGTEIAPLLCSPRYGTIFSKYLLENIFLHYCPQSHLTASTTFCRLPGVQHNTLLNPRVLCYPPLHHCHYWHRDLTNRCFVTSRLRKTSKQILKDFLRLPMTFRPPEVPRQPPATASQN